MKRMIYKMQDLQKKAAALQELARSAPGKAAELREQALMTAGELQQLRSELQSSVDGLRIQTEDRLVKAMQEITESVDLFLEAGYELYGLDLDLTLAQRLTVHLEKVEEAPLIALRSSATNEGRPVIKSILMGLLKAEEMLPHVSLNGLDFSGVIVHIGAMPLIRMSWRSAVAVEDVEQAKDEEESAFEDVATPPPLPGTAPSSASHPSIFGSSPLQSSIDASTRAQPAPPIIAEHIAASSSPKEEAPRANQWSRSALDRFKKMPDLSKRRSYE